MSPSPRSRSGLNAEELEDLVTGEQSLFEGLSSASLLLTGATGWFGTWLLDSLCVADDMLDLGLRITIVSRDPSRFLRRFSEFADDRRISWIQRDVRQLDPPVGCFTHIIHGAADSARPNGVTPAANLFGTIVGGTEKILNVAGSECRGVLVISSGAVYGPSRPGEIAFTELQAGGPDPATIKNAYAEAKRAAEMMSAIKASQGFRVSIARCFAFVGAHMPFDQHFAIGNFIADAVAGRQVRVRSDGLPLRSYMYMTDLIRALLLILNRGAAGAAYNVGSDIPISIGQLAHTVNRVVGGGGVFIEGKASNQGEHYVPDTHRLQLELKFQPTVDLEEAIARTAAWYRARADISLP